MGGGVEEDAWDADEEGFADFVDVRAGMEGGFEFDIFSKEDIAIVGDGFFRFWNGRGAEPQAPGFCVGLVRR